MNYTYEEDIHQIQNTKRFGHHTGAEVSKHILEQLGNPQNGIPFVHIAGTNGKGSTTAFLSSIMEKAGKKVGMFTSPHLVDFEERIRINGQLIPKEDVTRLGNRLLNMEFAYAPTMFDYCLAMAVLYFAEQKCDIMVMETGIGGRHDSTNALGVPKLAVITKIGYDHTAILGETLEEIALEKAGIIKAGCDVVVQRQEVVARDTIRAYHKKVQKEYAGTFYEITAEDVAYAASLPKKLLGEFQNENAATAICAARLLLEETGEKQDVLTGSGQEVEETVVAGIAATEWKGRMELVNDNPFFLIDGAHNAHGVHALAQSLMALYPGEKFRFIMGVMADKDYEDMITELLPLALSFVTVTPESNRALQASDLADCITKKGIPATYTNDMREAIAPYLGSEPDVKNAPPGTMADTACADEKTVAFGSLYFIGAIEAML